MQITKAQKSAISSAMSKLTYTSNSDFAGVQVTVKEAIQEYAYILYGVEEPTVTATRVTNLASKNSVFLSIEFTANSNTESLNIICSRNFTSKEDPALSVDEWTDVFSNGTYRIMRFEENLDGESFDTLLKNAINAFKKSKSEDNAKAVKYAVSNRFCVLGSREMYSSGDSNVVSNTVSLF